MSLLKTLNLAHLPQDLQIHVSLYEDVKNAAFLQEQLLEGNADFEYAFIDASVILSSTHLLAAVFRAANDWSGGRLKSRNVHSEIVFCLSMNNNIAESFRRFGISPTTTSLVAIKVSRNPSINAATIQQHLSASVEGTQLPFEEKEIARFTDIAKVKKTYKLTDVGKGNFRGAGGKGRKESKEERNETVMVDCDSGKEEAERRELEMMVLGLMALRGAT